MARGLTYPSERSQWIGAAIDPLEMSKPEELEEAFRLRSH